MLTAMGWHVLLFFIVFNFIVTVINAIHAVRAFTIQEQATNCFLPQALATSKQKHGVKSKTMYSVDLLL
jgi:hypothetical protein